MLDDPRNASMMLHHFLVVTAALGRRAGNDALAHEDVNSNLPLDLFAPQKPLLILDEKGHIKAVLLFRPQTGLKSRLLHLFGSSFPHFTDFLAVPGQDLLLLDQ